jgi:pimeloyl-ACP methyl ester carboxylesterase
MWLLLAFIIADSSSRSFAVSLARAESLHVVVSGTGSPVVLVPGLLGAAFGYRKVIPPLVAAGYRVVVIEPLGVGGSARPRHADYSLTAQADRIAAVLDELELRDAVIVAHALGASMAYRLAYRRPDLVVGIVSLEGGPAESAATPGLRRAMRFAPLLKLFGGMGTVRKKVRAELAAGSGDPTWIDDRVIDGYTAGAARDLGATLRAYRGMTEAREPERLEPNLPAIRCPVLLIVGAPPHGATPGASQVALLAERIPRFAVDSVPGVGHFIQEERPEVVVAAVDRLQAEVS